MNINEYLQLLTDRYSVRAFSSEKVSEEDISAFLHAAQPSPRHAETLSVDTLAARETF